MAMIKAMVILHKIISFPLKISSVNVTKSLMENFIFCAVSHKNKVVFLKQVINRVCLLALKNIYQ